MPILPARIGPIDERHAEMRDWLAAEMDRLDLRASAGEIWFAVTVDASGKTTHISVVELVIRLDNGENLIDHYELFFEPFSRAAGR
jgi:hypothetical protein